MASLRMLKKDIDYLIEEILADSYMAIYFHSDKKDEVIKLMEEAVALRNNLYSKANSPAEKHNKSLVKKHYAQVRKDMFTGVDDLFQKLSSISK